MHPILQTPCLILRLFTQADAPLLLQLNSNPKILKYLHEPPLETEQQALQILNTIILPQYQNNWGRKNSFKNWHAVFKRRGGK
jgi:RimJ/RimL family protein N-acetyltransferase